MTDNRKDLHKRVVIGAEIEAYSIDLTDLHIGRRVGMPKRGVAEAGEHFTHDTSIGSEYNSRPFATVRESLFLLKTGLRKYMRGFYRNATNGDENLVPLLTGSWTNRVAGVHLHVSISDHTLTMKEAKSLAFHVHDHLPLLAAAGANSPIWGRRITSFASVRHVKGSDTYFAPLRRGALGIDENKEMCFVPERKRKDKPPTLEIRVLDSNLPQFVATGLTLVKAICLRWIQKKPASNRISYEDYLESRNRAAHKGMRARLCWNGEWLTASAYLDRFLWTHREELEMMDVPTEVFNTLRWIKKGYNGSRLLRDAALEARRRHPQTWQRRFAKRYVQGLHEVLSGNGLHDFAKALEVEVPDTSKVWLGRKRTPIDG